MRETSDISDIRVYEECYGCDDVISSPAYSPSATGVTQLRRFYLIQYLFSNSVPAFGRQ